VLLPLLVEMALFNFLSVQRIVCSFFYGGGSAFFFFSPHWQRFPQRTRGVRLATRISLPFNDGLRGRFAMVFPSTAGRSLVQLHAHRSSLCQLFCLY